VEKELQVAIQAALEAGRILRENWGGDFAIEKKGEIDLVTAIDYQVEKIIIDRLLSAFPSHSVLAEESGASEQKSDFLWIVDPLDGTTNFAHTYPCFCTSIALEVSGELQLGVVYEPLRQELFTVISGKGAFLNDKKIHVSQAKNLLNSLLCTGFAYDVRENKRNNLRQFEKFILTAQGVRRDGAAALDLSFVGCGHFDGFWEFNLKPWDIAAGVLLIREAGGMVTAVDGSSFDLRSGNILASNGKIHQEMIEVLAHD